MYSSDQYPILRSIPQAMLAYPPIDSQDDTAKLMELVDRCLAMVLNHPELLSTLNHKNEILVTYKTIFDGACLSASCSPIIPLARNIYCRCLLLDLLNIIVTNGELYKDKTDKGHTLSVADMLSVSARKSPCSTLISWVNTEDYKPTFFKYLTATTTQLFLLYDNVVDNDHQALESALQTMEASVTAVAERVLRSNESPSVLLHACCAVVNDIDCVLAGFLSTARKLIDHLCTVIDHQHLEQL